MLHSINQIPYLVSNRSEIYINTTKGLVLSKMSATDVLSNATLIIMNNGGHFVIEERSYVLVNDA